QQAAGDRPWDGHFILRSARRSRSNRTFSRSIASVGCLRSVSMNSSCPTNTQSTLSIATAVAERGQLSIAPISPKYSPLPTTAIVFRRGESNPITISTMPDTTRYAASLGSPSRKITSPATKLRRVMTPLHPWDEVWIGNVFGGNLSPQDPRDPVIELVPSSRHRPPEPPKEKPRTASHHPVFRKISAIASKSGGLVKWWSKPASTARCLSSGVP